MNDSIPVGGIGGAGCPGSQAVQFGLPLEGVELPHAQAFEAWKQEAGSRQVLNYIYRMAARYARRFQATGQRVSVRLLWELTRDHVHLLRREMRARGFDLKKWNGVRLNDHFHAHVARHILQRRPEWRGLFEVRELKGPRKVKRRITVEEFHHGSHGERR